MAILRNYNTLSQFNSEAVHPENKICFIKDKGVLYSNGVQYSCAKMNPIVAISDTDSIIDKFNELRTQLLDSNLMRQPRIPIVYYTGNSNTISINYTSYTAEANKVTIGGVEYYQVKLDKDFDDNFYKFSNGTFTNLIFKDVNTTNVTNMKYMFSGCGSLASLNLSEFNISNVTCTNSMFRYDISLISLNLCGWDTNKVTDVSYMFDNCTSLTSLNLSKWNLDNVMYTNDMFQNCTNLKTIRMVGCSQTTVDRIKAQLTKDSITDCTVLTE